MNNVVTCVAVLALAVDRSRADSIYLAVPPDWHLRVLPCRPKGQPRKGDGPEWEYEEKDGRLHLTPSMLATDTQFHTDYHWSCAYIVKPEGVEGYDFFYSQNPTIAK